MSSKKTVKPAAARQQAQSKPKPLLPKSTSNWLVRPATETEQDPLLKKIFASAGVVILLTTIILALGSGINADDEYQDDYSQRLVRHYTSFGSDEAALQIDSTAKDPYNKGKMYFYGGVFDLLTGLTNAALGNNVLDQSYHDVRHVFNAIFGFLAMLFTALLAKEIAGWRAGILSLIFLFLSPRFVGHSLMNPKDIPFAAGYVIALYHMVLLFRQMPKPTWKTALGLALGIGLAIGTRAGGMILFAYLGLFGGIDFLMKRGSKGMPGDGQMIGKYVAWGAGAAVAGFIIALLFWPYAMQSPLSHPFDALGEFSKLGVKIRVLFKGENVMSDQTSWDYPLQWIWRTIPLFTLLGFLGSLVLLKKILDRYAVLPVLLALFAAVFPVLYIILKDSILHDGWRHLTFVYPTMVVMATLFYVTLEGMLTNNKIGKYAVYVALALMALEPAFFIARNTETPYVYFSPASGGISSAFGNFETDYWGVGVRPALEWLEKEGKIKPGMTDTVVIGTSFVHNVRTYVEKKYGGKVKVLYQKFNDRYNRPWDYGIFPSRYIRGGHLRARTWPNSRSIHEVTANGVPLVSVEQGGGAIFQGEPFYKEKNWALAADAFQKETQAYPDNEIAWMKLAMTYFNMMKFPETRQAADELLKIAPENTTALVYRGLAYLNTNDLANAKADFQAAVDAEGDNSTALYYLALTQAQTGDKTSALQNLDKVMQLAPGFQQAAELRAQLMKQ